MPKMGYFVVDGNYEQIHGFGRYESLHAACEDAFEYLLLSRHYPSKMPAEMCILVVGIEAFTFDTEKPSHVMMKFQPGADLKGWVE